ncbi:MAG: hypothetical protein VYD87_06705 [Pseudomonadota bacterium]|nr:hypothetical protein [Pseudomonadota bacterium]MEE3098727.1 hypothetical protein [Pseudomonadota bacterium]
MAMLWTDEEYAKTNRIYEEALAVRRAGRPRRRVDIVQACRQATGRKADGSVLMHLGNLTSARMALGLATLPEFPALEHHPKKLTAFLERRVPRD